MDPINQKEITTSFIQFMVLFLITVVFAIVCVFFDVDFSQKSYKVLRNDYNTLKQNSQNDFVPVTIQFMDSTRKVIQGLDVNNPNEFSIQKSSIFRTSLYDNPSDTTFQGKIKRSAINIFIEWINDKERLSQSSQLQKEIDKRDKFIKNMQDVLKQNYKMTPEQLDMLKN